jgi:hypothetical protein
MLSEIAVLLFYPKLSALGSRCYRKSQSVRIPLHLRALAYFSKRWNRTVTTSRISTSSTTELGTRKHPHPTNISDVTNQSPPLNAYYAPRVSDLIAGVALETGFIFDRWRKIVNVLIKKIPGRPLLHNLPVIHLLEAVLKLAMDII